MHSFFFLMCFSALLIYVLKEKGTQGNTLMSGNDSTESAVQDDYLEAQQRRCITLSNSIAAAIKEQQGLVDEAARLSALVEKRRQTRAEELQVLGAQLYAKWSEESASLRESITTLESKLAEAVAFLESMMEVLTLDESASREQILKEENVSAKSYFVQHMSVLYLPRQCNDSSGRPHATLEERLYQLWLHSRDVLDSTEIRGLLSAETSAHRLKYHTELGADPWIADSFGIPFEDVLSFMSDVVFQLPALRQLHLACLPSLRLWVLPLIERLPHTLTSLFIRLTPYEAADLVALAKKCSHAPKVFVSSSACTNWSEFSVCKTERQKQVAVNMKCKGLIHWQ